MAGGYREDIHHQVELVMEVGGRDLLGIASPLLRQYYGSLARYAEAAVDYGLASVIIARLGREAVGASVYYVVRIGLANTCVVYYLLVKEGFRGLGIGSALLATTEEVCVPVDAYVATTWLSNSIAHRLYSSMGYVGFTWEELRRIYGAPLVKRLLKSTCGYDDDVVYVKLGMNGELGDLFNKMKMGSTDNIDRLWRKICLEVWSFSKNIRG